jgi:hypothetical protein
VKQLLLAHSVTADQSFCTLSLSSKRQDFSLSRSVQGGDEEGWHVSRRPAAQHAASPLPKGDKSIGLGQSKRQSMTAERDSRSPCPQHVVRRS